MLSSAVDVVRTDQSGDRRHQSAGQIGLAVDVGVDKHEQRRIFCRWINRDGFVAGQASVVADPAGAVEQSESVSGSVVAFASVDGLQSLLLSVFR